MQDAEIKLLVKEKADSARNQALGVFSVIALLVTLLTSLGIYGLVVNYIDKSIRTAIENKGVEEALAAIQKSEQEAETMTEAIKAKQKSVEDLTSNISIVLGKARSSGWLSKAPIPQKYNCPKGHVMVGLDFTHKVHQNMTHQESYRVHCAPIRITTGS